MGVGGMQEDPDFQSWLMHLGVRCPTNGSDTLYILSGGRADAKRTCAPVPRA